MSGPHNRVFELAAAILEQHLRLDGEIDKSMNAVIGDSESAALAIIEQVRKLHDTATQLGSYIDGSNLKTGNLKQEIDESMTSVADLGTFIGQLPAKMQRDLHDVQVVVKEIKELSGMISAVQAISMQSHLLSINASIEASHAGPAGAAFRVVADEMRKLAANSGAVATKINEGLSRARRVVETGMAANLANSSRQLEEVSQAANAIQKVMSNFEDMNHFNKTRFAVIEQFNANLSKDIAEVLGQIQFQDVIRQYVERMRAIIQRRNGVLQEAIGLVEGDGASLAAIPAQLELVFDEYVAGEAKHRHSEREAPDTGELKIELF